MFKEQFKNIIVDDFEIGFVVGEGAASRVYKGNTACVQQCKCNVKSSKFQTLLVKEDKALLPLKNDPVIALQAISLWKISLIMEYAAFSFDNGEEMVTVYNLRQLTENIQLDMQLDFVFSFIL